MAAIDMLSAFRYTFLCQREERGGIAQLGERLHGMQEVRGSIPLVSTIRILSGFLLRQGGRFLFLGSFSFGRGFSLWSGEGAA